MRGIETSDDPEELWQVLGTSCISSPTLLNVKTNRLFWYAGAGIDSPTIPDLHKKWLEKEDVSIFEKEKERVNKVWNKCLKLSEK